jgi:hypothetical protein
MHRGEGETVLKKPCVAMIESREEMTMQISNQAAQTQAVEKAERPDPSGFVMSVAVTLFVLTLVAVITMYYAQHWNWQVL